MNKFGNNGSYIEEIIKDSKIPMQRRFLTFYGKLEDKAVLGTDMYNIDCAFVSEWGNCGSLRTYYYKSSFCGESNADLTVSTFLHGNALAVLILLFEVI